MVMERLLARLFVSSDAPWLLKGGYAMDLRFRPNARTTRDLDLTASAEGPDHAARLAAARELLQDEAGVDAGDYLVFRIGVPQRDLQGPPLGGARFPVVALLAGREYARFHIDVGFGDAVIGEPDVLTGEDFFRFAELPPAHAIAIPKAQQFAEKIHAYTYPWTGRLNTRVKDLVDLIVLIQRGDLDPQQVRAAVRGTFSMRQTHPVPDTLPDVPATWAREFASLAEEAGLTVRDPGEAIATVREHWVRAGIAR